MIGNYIWNGDSSALSYEVECGHLVENFSLQLSGCIEVGINRSHSESYDPRTVVREENLENGE